VQRYGTDSYGRHAHSRRHPTRGTRPRLSETMREAILTAVTVPASAKGPSRGANAASAAERIAAHAVALRALLTEAPSVLSPAERQLLSDWLDRLATARSPRAPRRRSPRGSPADAQRPSHEVVKRLGVRGAVII
jgi:hypothetical protein